MSPETGISVEVIDEQAPRVTDTLLRIEERADEAWMAVINEGLADVRSDLGYAAVKGFDFEDMVDSRVVGQKIPVIKPYSLDRALPVSPESAQTTFESRKNIEKIINGEDDRLLVVAGPCSIHDADTATEYANWLLGMREEYKDTLEIVMRAYMEKPRTELGWKGYVNDPQLTDEPNMNLGLVKSRMLSQQITSIGVPIALERLNALTPQYFNGLVAYDTIGARNVTDQKAREYASGTSSPVGFKNSPEGNVLDAVNAIVSARAPHTFLGLDEHGRVAQVNTTGNDTGHIILRGGSKQPNYGSEDIENAQNLLNEKGLKPAIVVDCSHGNTIVVPDTGALDQRITKDYKKQIKVLHDITTQISEGNDAIKGVMVESNLKEGSIKFTAGETDPSILKEDNNRGLSITDACLGLRDTEAMLAKANGAVHARRKTQK